MGTDDRDADGISRHWSDPRGATARAGAVDGERRRELRRRVDEGFYLTPRLTWEVARRIAARGDA